MKKIKERRKILSKLVESPKMLVVALTFMPTLSTALLVPFIFAATFILLEVYNSIMEVVGDELEKFNWRDLP